MASGAAATPATCSYELDTQLRLVAVDTAWATFALDNGAPELLPPAPLGRSILSFVSDPTTAHVYEQIFRRVEARRAPLEFGIRCDSATLRRFLRIAIDSRQEGFRLSSTVLRTETRPVQPLLEPHRERDASLLRMCSWCKKVEVGVAWMEVEAAVQELALFERARLPGITHGMCQACYEAMAAIVDS